MNGTRPLSPLVTLNTCETCHFYRSVGSDPTLCCTESAPFAVLTVVQHLDPIQQKPVSALQKHTFFPSPEPTWTCGKHRSRRTVAVA